MPNLSVNTTIIKYSKMFARCFTVYKDKKAKLKILLTEHHHGYRDTNQITAGDEEDFPPVTSA